MNYEIFSRLLLMIIFVLAIFLLSTSLVPHSCTFGNSIRHNKIIYYYIIFGKMYENESFTIS